MYCSCCTTRNVAWKQFSQRFVPKAFYKAMAVSMIRKFSDIIFNKISGDFILAIKSLNFQCIWRNYFIIFKLFLIYDTVTSWEWTTYIQLENDLGGRYFRIFIWKKAHHKCDALPFGFILSLNSSVNIAYDVYLRIVVLADLRLSGLKSF